MREHPPLVLLLFDVFQVPLAAGSVDIVVFCLSLMGVNMMDFVKEAIRILTPDGIIKVSTSVVCTTAYFQYEKTYEVQGTIYRLPKSGAASKVLKEELKRLLKACEHWGSSATRLIGRIRCSL